MDWIIWLKAHWDDVIKGYLALVGLASIIVKMTPTLKDDNILLGIVKFVGRFIALGKYGPDGVDRPR